MKMETPSSKIQAPGKTQTPGFNPSIVVLDMVGLGSPWSFYLEAWSFAA